MREQLILPTMGCGTWAWGNRLLWGYQPSMDQELQQVFDFCVTSGITLFDTGDSYGTGRLSGRSESLLGQFSQAYTGRHQQEIVLATKLAPYPWRLTAGSMKRAGAASAKRLQRPIDLVQMHWSTANYAPWQEKRLLRGLAELYETGQVKGVGLSNYGGQRLREMHRWFQDWGVPIRTLQVQYSLLSTDPVLKYDVKAVCDELGIQLIAYSPLALGLLTGKYSLDQPLPKGLRRRVFKQVLPNMAPLQSCLRELMALHQKTMAQVALNWCICKGTMPIPGAKNLTQAQENAGALGWHLSAAEVEALDQAAAQVTKTMVQNPFQSR
ncbi:aldo/keto reductase [Picosynechococcus sp. PCC 11901]|uniref:aldo/keto reductase n=1 Tax=Picosynechococcus sp. PCC 11901 TaxID=2579791 RepID=UPI0010FC0C05|nr:aldo/keto reductase [Picosynechococcus sp. PCC 11901]QCS49351.1 aldo/keto reductase [Picosynechococcus sp. PCC 11901]